MPQSQEDLVRFANAELLGKGNLAVVDDVFAGDYIVHTGGKEYKGHAFVKRFIGQIRSAMPDVRVVKVEVLMQAGDTIAWQRTLRGTHQADLMGIPASGQKVEWRDMLVSRFDGGKIAEEWAASELAGQLMLSLPAHS